MKGDLYKCLNNANRRKILYCIGEEEKCVNEIAECLDIEQSLTSHHLKDMLDCGLIEKRREGKRFYYKVSESEIIEILEKGKDLGDKLEERC
ncbi:MAG: winged helix-turn-helix transcriptional regulator [Candidatus Thermoplasmatota archaeon]|nr:winged helix-turn-helix transcriptional regulator [Candidatus Thermoplasmatota archaeon]MBS3790639.1 winged helix-turn-helix transcriptional regulator [Candidatus Thermoplasmatota archaeon]